MNSRDKTTQLIPTPSVNYLLAHTDKTPDETQDAGENGAQDPWRGFIKLWRTPTWTSPAWYANAKPRRRASEFEAWLDLWLMANWKQSELWDRGELLTIERGQVLTGKRALAERWRWDRHRVQRLITKHEALSLLRTHTDPHKRTLLTICDYELTQGQRASNAPADDPGGDPGGDPRGDPHQRSLKKIKKIKNSEGAPSALSDGTDRRCSVCDHSWAQHNGTADGDCILGYCECHGFRLSGTGLWMDGT